MIGIGHLLMRLVASSSQGIGGGGPPLLQWYHWSWGIHTSNCAPSTPTALPHSCPNGCAKPKQGFTSGPSRGALREFGYGRPLLCREQVQTAPPPPPRYAIDGWEPLEPQKVGTLVWRWLQCRFGLAD